MKHSQDLINLNETLYVLKLKGEHYEIKLLYLVSFCQKF